MTSSKARAREWQRTWDERMALPIIPEDPARLQGPDVGAVMRYIGTYGDKYGNPEATVLERSYVWAPDQRNGQYRGFRRYDWSVVEYTFDGHVRRVVIDDKHLEPIE